MDVCSMGRRACPAESSCSARRSQVSSSFTGDTARDAHVRCKQCKRPSARREFARKLRASDRARDVCAAPNCVGGVLFRCVADRAGADLAASARLLAGDGGDLYVVAIAVAGNVRFDVGAGFTVPTQAVFVPMLFAAAARGRAAARAASRWRSAWLPAIVRGGDLAELAADGARQQLVRDRPGARARARRRSQSRRDAAAVLLVALWQRSSPATSLRAAVRERLVSGIRRCAELLDEVAPDLRDRPRPLGAGARRRLRRRAGAHESARARARRSAVRACCVSSPRSAATVWENLVELSDAYRGTALVLGNVVEADDGYTGEHSGESYARPGGRRRARAERRPRAQPRVWRAAARRRQDRDPKEIINKPGPLDHQSGRSSRRTRSRVSGCSRRSAGSMREVGRIVRSTTSARTAAATRTACAGRRSHWSRGWSRPATPSTR